MLRYKRITTGTLTNGVETIGDLISCPKGKKYTIKTIATAPLADMYLRLYKNSEQIVDLTLNEGDVVKAGFFNNGAATTAKQITIGYTDN
jgi:hypothetical protein